MDRRTTPRFNIDGVGSLRGKTGDRRQETGDGRRYPVSFAYPLLSETKMKIETEIPLIDEILGDSDHGYRNHVYRMVNFCFAQGEFDAEEKEKIVIAGCFHDLGIWSADTWDYLPPSIDLANRYLERTSREDWQDEISTMIDLHHRIRRCEDGSLVEIFRRGDLVDFSLGLFKCGIRRDFIRAVKLEFPNAGFHRQLATHACRWTVRHPLNPVPVLKW